MNILHWVIGFAIFGGFAGFITFAFRQGQQVKPDVDTQTGVSLGPRGRWTRQ